MKGTMAKVLFIAMLAPRLLLAFDENDAKERVKQIKAWLPNYRYAWALKIASEDALQKAILFIEDPNANFRLTNGMNMSEFWENCRLYERFMYDTNRTRSGFYLYERLRAVTAEMSEEKASLMTFLILNCPAAAYKELLTDLYMKLFACHAGLFIDQLKKRQDWKRVVDELDSASANRVRSVVDSLGDSDFEKEFKKYILEEHHPIIREDIQGERISGIGLP